MTTIALGRFTFSVQALLLAIRAVLPKHCPKVADHTAVAHNSLVLEAFLATTGKAIASIAVHTGLGGRVDESFWPFIGLLDMPVAKRQFKIVGAFKMPIKFVLMVNKGASISGIKHIVGHNQALIACRRSIGGLKGVTADEVMSSEDAALSIRGRMDFAALGSAQCAAQSGYAVLDEDFGGEGAVTTFYVLAKGLNKIQTPQSDTHRVLVAASLSYEVGSLLKLLEPLRHYNLTHLTSTQLRSGVGFGLELDVPKGEVDNVVAVLSKLVPPEDLIVHSFPIVSL